MPALSIAPRGLCVKTCFYCAGPYMHAIVTIVRNGNAQVYKASVDVEAIRRALASRAEVSGFFSSISHAVSHVTHSSLLKKIGKAIKSVPVIGPVATAVVSLETLPYSVGLQLAKGGRIDRVALGSLHTAVRNAKTIAPYAQAVVSFVPGVGQGLSGALGASLALANGQSITSAMVEATKGAMPGGPLAVAAFNVAHSLAKGDGIDRIALNALPISDQAKTALTRGISLAKDLASGKRVDLAIIDQATKSLPPAILKAVQIGTAIGHAVAVQTKARKPGSSPVLLPPVSHEAVAAFAIAKNAIDAIDTGNAVHARVTQIANSSNPIARAAAHANLAAIQTAVAHKKVAQDAIARLAARAKAGDREALAAQRIFAIVLRQHQALKSRVAAPSAARGVPAMMITSTGRIVPGHYLEQRANAKLKQAVLFDGKKILLGKYAAA